MSTITTYYLEMNSPAALVDGKGPEDVRLRECRIKQFEFNRFLYQLVGRAWHWTDRLSWSDERWRACVEDDNLRTWVAYCKGAPAGYYELQMQDGGNVEIVYFGLAPGFIGRGLGGWLLSRAIRSAWAWQGARRVWVHTCSLDHPYALRNYEARGMTVYRTDPAG